VRQRTVRWPTDRRPYLETNGIMKQQCKQELANSQTSTRQAARALPGPRLASAGPASPQTQRPPHADFPECRDDPAQAEELERQQDA
jgi:hypothetical protein